MTPPALEVRVLDVQTYLDDCTTRLPFGFGITTMTSAPLLTARVTVESADGTRAVGHSADLLVPKWFEKDPAKSVEQDRAALFASAREAGAAWRASSACESVFEGWWRVYRQRVHARPPDASDRLLRGFGVALIERAVMDAACRAAGLSFFEALRADLFAFRPGQVHAALADWDLASSLGAAPSQRIELRHTVGLSDPIRTRDIEPAARVRDGLPQSLEEYVARQGLRVFKIKLCGDPERDLARLREIAGVLQAGVRDGPRWTVDGNEQFGDLQGLRELLEQLASDSAGQRFLEGLISIEQPLPRARSFEAAQAAPLAALSAIAPVILDEADHGIEAFPRGLELGYAGVSVKNCKGVFRALLNRGLCERHGAGAFQSAEDLTNLGVLALQQDLATCAALGLGHVERNGHHYFHGLDHLPAEEARDALRVHAGLYEPLGEGAGLRVVDGQLDLRSLQCAGYGYAVDVRCEQREARP